jgi:hypothetical protein
MPRRHPLNLIRVMPAKGRTHAMTTSLFLARLMGPVALLAGISLLFNREAYLAMAKEFMQSPALIYLSGLLTMIAGVAILLAHNLWVADWRVIITVTGWLATIGGAIRIALPGQTRALGAAMLESRTALYAGAGVWLVAGALLCYFGYLR